jgi:NAD(P)-dependent dehydrogenase (short-subunit alcohol dehydrogenase family)
MTVKVALVTGASSGIGDATARRLAQLGYIVYAVARRVDRMAALKERGIRTEAADVTDDAALVSLVDKIISDAGRIDVLVNNAGYGSYGALEDVPIAEARRQFDVNVFGLARLTQLVLPHMRAQRDGYIVNVSSVGGKIWEPLGSWYHATKFAVEGLSDSLRAEVAEFGIKVIVIEPGAIRTEWAAISADNLKAASASTPYREQARFVGGALRTADKSRLTSGPDVVANAIAKAVQSPRPRTRYAVGGGARGVLLAQRVLTDRGFDRLIRTSYRAIGRQG